MKLIGCHCVCALLCPELGSAEVFAWLAGRQFDNWMRRWRRETRKGQSWRAKETTKLAAVAAAAADGQERYA